MAMSLAPTNLSDFIDGPINEASDNKLAPGLVHMDVSNPSNNLAPPAVMLSSQLKMQNVPYMETVVLQDFGHA